MHGPEKSPVLVIDTNVVVSGLLRSGSKPNEVLRRVVLEQAVLIFDEWIWAEYIEVLSRPSLKIPFNLVLDWLITVRLLGIIIQPSPLTPPPPYLPDESDIPFAEVAVTARATALVSGNARHFAFLETYGVMVLSPAAFLEKFPYT